MIYEQLGEGLETLCRVGRNEAVLVAPFIKRLTLGRLLEAIPASVALLCITRWRPEEIAANVSDPDIWLDIQQRENTALRLCPSLHAKYYRIDDKCLIGSANITNAALGWSSMPNLEILCPFVGTIREWQAFEQTLTDSSVPCQEAIYQEMKATAALLQAEMKTFLRLSEAITGELLAETRSSYGATETADMDIADLRIWVPQCRQPTDLYFAYSDQWQQLTSASRSTSLIDLTALQIPPGLAHPLFVRYVSTQLLQFPCIAAVDTFVSQSQRFGAVRDYLAALPCSKSPNFDATRTWQTLMRWLLYFLPERYELSIPSHSEIFQVRTHSPHQ